MKLKMNSNFIMIKFEEKQIEGTTLKILRGNAGIKWREKKKGKKNHRC